MDLSYQVMVYDSTAEAYRNLMDALPALFRSYHVTEEYPTDRIDRRVYSEPLDQDSKNPIHHISSYPQWTLPPGPGIIVGERGVKGMSDIFRKLNPAQVETVIATEDLIRVTAGEYPVCNLHQQSLQREE